MKNNNSNNSILFILFVTFTITVKAQKNDTIKLPESIYTIPNFLKNENDLFRVSKLNFDKLNFRFIDVVDNELNFFSVDVKNSYQATSKFISDDILRYRNKNLLKGFLIKYDPTRWNLHRLPSSK